MRSNKVFLLLRLTGSSCSTNVYVEKGYYENGKLYLDVVNTVGASKLVIDANSTVTETDQRQSFTQVLNLDSNKTKETIIWNIGYIFDAGFAISNNLGGGTDVLYFADGPWGADYERNTGVRSAALSIIPEAGYNVVANERHLERGAQFNGDVKNYVSLFRMLRPGNGLTDLSDYNQIEFEASLTGANEIVVTLVSDSVAQWQNQFKTTVSVTNGSLNRNSVDFADFKSLARGKIRRSDLVNVTFSVVGDQSNFNPTTLIVDNINFTQNGRGLGAEDYANNKEENLTVYPNPFSYNTTIDFNVAQAGDYRIEL